MNHVSDETLTTGRIITSGTSNTRSLTELNVLLHDRSYAHSYYGINYSPHRDSWEFNLVKLLSLTIQSASTLCNQ